MISPPDDAAHPRPWPYRAGQRWRWGLGAVRDALRLPGTALGLNLRKTWWIAQGRPDTAPCQSASDSGLAGQTHCEAMIDWADKNRFRRVCPLLQQQPDGAWKCGVDTVRVRPFWGRAAAAWTVILVSLWLVATVPVWVVLRQTGAKVSLWQVGWPGSWPEISRARSRAYVARAEQAFAAKHFDEMALDLQSAINCDPKNLQARLYLANIAWIQGNFETAHERFAAMLQEFPEQRPALARLWLPKLLVAGEFIRIQTLAQAMLTEDAAEAGPWAHALVFAARQTRDAAVLAKAAALPGLPVPIRAVLAANAAGLSGQRLSALKLLADLAPTGDNARFVVYQQIEGMLEFGAPEPALVIINHDRGHLIAADLLYFRLRAYRQQGWDETVQLAIRDSFQQIDLLRLNALALYLVRCHDRSGLIRVLQIMKSAPRAEKLDAFFATLYLAAGLWGDRDLMPPIALLAGEKSPLPASLLSRFDKAAQQPGHLGEALGSLPLPLEAVYAAYGAIGEQNRMRVQR